MVGEVMYIPYLNPIENRSKQYVVAFRGLNFTEGWQDGDLKDCYNLSTEKYPCISPRAARVQEHQYSNPSTIHAKAGLMVIDGTDVYYNHEKVGEVTAGNKQTEAVGDYIVIFPDKAYYNVSRKEFGSLEASMTASNVVFTSSTITIGSDTVPFRPGDAVEISGCTVHSENNKTIIVRSISGNKMTFYDNSFTAGTETGEITIKRSVPDLDFICESNYRLWGTHGNTIYASKFSDPFNFQVFDGLSSDSYYIDLGSDGKFTGCISYSSHICFFKENVLHKLYGSKPSNYQVVTSNVYGVQEGCERSMCIVNETLLYKGVEGVYAYTGGVPELISSPFGIVRFTDAVAACDGERYYISMQREGRWRLFVYDVLRSMWLAEDNTHAVDMVAYEGQVYYLDANGALMKIDRNADRSEIEWQAVFCPFNETMNNRKGYSKFHLRLELDAGAWVAVDRKLDDDLTWEEVYVGHNEHQRMLNVPVQPVNCDSVTIRLRGKGKCVVRTFVREFTQGGER